MLCGGKGVFQVPCGLHDCAGARAYSGPGEQCWYGYVVGYPALVEHQRAPHELGDHGQVVRYENEGGFSGGGNFF